MEKQQAQLKTTEQNVKKANRNRDVIDAFEGGNRFDSENSRRGESRKKKEVKLVDNFESNWDDDSDDGGKRDRGMSIGASSHASSDDWGASTLESKLLSLGVADVAEEDEDQELGDAWD